MANDLGTAEAAGLRAKERSENFPVALRILPRRYRVHLLAVYAFARSVDDLGDEVGGDRPARLDEFAADLGLIWSGGSPASPVLRRLAGTVAARGLDRQPFFDLVAANRQDQVVSRYPAYADLLNYCALSANPVGRIVLGVFGADVDPDGYELSDAICTGLQLLDHWQDVVEDLRDKSRIYLPTEDLEAYGVTEADLVTKPTPEAVRRLLAFETERADALLTAGVPLVGRVRGWARVALAGYLAGGRAAADALRRAEFDVSGGAPKARELDVLRHASWLLLVRPGLVA